MERIFDLYKEFIVKHPKYSGVVCGYTEAHFILAVKTKDTNNFFRVLKGGFYVMDKYKDQRYRYIFEDENVVEQQFKFGPQWLLKKQKTTRKARNSKKP